MTDFPEPAFMADEEIRMFADSVARFLRRAAPPERVAGWRADGMVEREFWREAGQAGLLGVSVPEAYGGPGGDFRHDAVVAEAVIRHGADGFAAGLHNAIILPYIQAHGTEGQKQRWLPKLVSGELVSAIAMSEPGAGSDLQSVRTTALRDGNGYRINGAKTFISNGQVADLVIVVAKTDPSEGAKGVSLLVVETDEVEGFRRGGKLDKIGLDAQDTSELFFDDVWVPADNLLGLEEGKGFYQLMAELPRERLLIAHGSAVAMEKAIAETLLYVRERKAFGKPILDFQNSQFTLADCKAKAVVARVFVNHCIERLLAGELDLPTA
ncbi:MAG TPA: acyl-CoA dehydrogenase family protein, partial [Allosphingosinicella sp.]|nr:acyl-CoA dehydrogenase family protein [Allosphingosinicella sp.]